MPPLGGEPEVAADDDFDDDVWAGVQAPRFRSDVGSYSEGDFGDDPLHDDTTALGALVDMPEIDDDEEFAAEVAARRAPSRRPRARTRPERPAPGHREPASRGARPPG